MAAYGDNRDSTYFKFIGFTVDSASKWALDIEGGLVDNCVLKNSGSSGTMPFFFRGTKVRNVTVFNNIGVSIFGFQQVGTDQAGSPKWEVESSLFYNNKALSSNTESDNRGGPWQQKNIGGLIWSVDNTKGKLFNSIFYNNSGDNIISSGGGRPSDSLDVINNIFFSKMFRN